MSLDFIIRVARSSGINIFVLFLKLATVVLLARLMGPEQYGVYVSAFAIMTILAIPAQAGLPVLVVREIAAYMAVDHWGYAKGLLGWVWNFVFLMSFVIAGGGLLVTLLLGDQISSADQMTLAWALLLLPSLALVRIIGASLRGFHHILVGQILQDLLRPLLFLAGIAVLFLFVGMEGLSAPQVMACHALVAAVGVVAALLIQKRYQPTVFSAAQPVVEVNRWLKSVLPLSLTAGLQIVLAKTDIIMIRAFGSAEEVAFYNVALQGAAAIFFMRTAVNAVSATKMAHCHKKEDKSGLQEIVSWSARILFIAALPAFLLVCLFGKPAIALLFGAEYLPAYLALVILGFGRLARSVFGPIDTLMKMANKETLLLKVVALSIVLNVVLNGALIPVYGIYGAAAASVLSMLTVSLLLVLHARKDLQITSFVFSFGWLAAPTKTLT